MWDLNELGILYLKIVSELEVKKAADKVLFVLSNEGQYMNFRPQDFKKVTLDHLPAERGYKLFMTALRTLGWIICDTDRFTCTQFINHKTVRVVTVDVSMYQLIAELVNQKKE